MTNNPLISIITVTFNAGNVIEKTLLSLKEQTFKDFEHLVIDGKSKDDTVKKIKDFGLPRTSVLSEPDKGLYDAMNKGLSWAKGRYILFLNAGDAFHSAATLQEYARCAAENPHIIYGDTDIVDKEGRFIAPRHLEAPPLLTKKSFLNGMLVCHQAFMVRKDIVPQFDLRYRFSADYDWCVKCIGKSTPETSINLNQVTIDYLSDGLSDKNKWKSLRERFRIMAHHYGLPLTVFRHLSFISRALKRGRL